ncbi:MAG: hypothetical protein QGH25_24515, partial [Candidatus Latescibacteria bacterium]|nr:hypothetical protein [Candidatus Latescibacterota bacterium]
ADADGELDAGEESVINGPLDGGDDGVVRSALLSGQRLAPGQRRSYLVVADVAAGIDATDQIAIDVVEVVAGAGVLGGGAPALEGGPVAGTVHRATGLIDMLSVELTRRQTGQSGDVALAFATTSLLLAGDRIRLLFPAGFDLSQATLDASSLTPSGTLPALDLFARTRRELVIGLAAAESAGSYRLALNGVYNTAVAARDLAVEIFSQRADGTPVDDRDPSPFRFSVDTAALSTVCRADFNGDGRVYFDDLFLFGDAFGGAGSSFYDLDGNNRIDVADFFVFADVFGQRCTDARMVDDQAL